IERGLGITFQQAEDIKLELGSNRLPPAKLTAAKRAIEKTLNVWTSGIELALAEFTNVEHLPHQIWLCGGGSSLDMLMEQLVRSNWYRELPFTRKPVIKHIQPEEVVDIKDATGLVDDHTFITAMGLLRVGLDTLQMQDG